MAEGNGSPVTRAELAAHIKGIDEHFDAVEHAVLEIKSLLTRKSAFWANAWVLVVASSIGAAAGTGFWFIH